MSTTTTTTPTVKPKRTITVIDEVQEPLVRDFVNEHRANGESWQQVADAFKVEHTDCKRGPLSGAVLSIHQLYEMAKSQGWGGFPTPKR